MRGFHRSCKIPPINALFLFSFCNELLIYFIIFVRVQLDIYIYTYIYMITAKNRRAKRLHSSTLEHWHFAHPTEVKWQVFLPLARHFIARSEGNKSGIVRSIKEKKRNGMHLETFTVQVRGHFETLNFYTGCFLAEGGDARSDITRVWNRKPKRTENRNWKVIFSRSET